MRKMNINTVATGTSLLLAAMFTMNSQAGTLDPGLEAAIEGMSPGDPVDVIIRCLDPLEPSSIDTDNLDQYEMYEMEKLHQLQPCRSCNISPRCLVSIGWNR